MARKYHNDCASAWSFPGPSVFDMDFFSKVKVLFSSLSPNQEAMTAAISIHFLVKQIFVIWKMTELIFIISNLFVIKVRVMVHGPST